MFTLLRWSGPYPTNEDKDSSLRQYIDMMEQTMAVRLNDMNSSKPPITKYLTNLKTQTPTTHNPTAVSRQQIANPTAEN